MKKLLATLLIFVLNIPLAMADVLPDYKPSEKIITWQNLINASDYPEWTFFQKVFAYWPQFYQIILNGDIGCSSASYHTWLEFWAMKNDKYDLSGLIYLSRNLEKEDMIKNWAIRIFEDTNPKNLPCIIVVKKTYEWEEVVNNIDLTPEMQKILGDFKSDIVLSPENVKIIESSVNKSYDKFKKDLAKFDEKKQIELYWELIVKIDELLKDEKRKEAIYTLSYLKYLAKRSLSE